MTLVSLTVSSTLFCAAAQAESGVLRIGQNQSLGGLNWTYSQSNSDLGEAGDRASSVWNESDSAWVMYQHDTFEGRHYCIRPDEKVSDLHRPQWQFGDMASSVRRLPTTECGRYPAFYASAP
jgi:hypothetical protein